MLPNQSHEPSLIQQMDQKVMRLTNFIDCIIRPIDERALL